MDLLERSIQLLIDDRIRSKEKHRMNDNEEKNVVGTEDSQVEKETNNRCPSGFKLFMIVVFGCLTAELISFFVSHWYLAYSMSKVRYYF